MPEDRKTTTPEQDHPTAGERLTAWFDSRTGVNEILHESLDEPIPGGAKWAYVFGSGLLYLFISQVITGVFLALYYVPSADHAHTVVSYIVKEVTSGSFLRSIHAYGSSGIIILLVLHIGQTILYGSYKGRRELLWLSGCILLALMLGMAFTGYLLPWDEKAYFASAVGTNLIAEVPLIGPPLQRLVRGGSQMGTLTLSRFYVLHVFILPAMIIAGRMNTCRT
jgi:ubiquinol-cytochrome c reductase cytochrome b subunit